MADDIDDLLMEADEYLGVVKPSEKDKTDRKFDDDTRIRSGSRALASSKTKLKSSNQNARRESDVSAMIDDILEDYKPVKKYPEKSNMSKQDNQNITMPANKPVSVSGQSKCFRVWLGGSEDKTGISTAVYQRCCDSLRCTDCDFHISMFDNYQWHSSTDYLFLRNNMPDYDRLKSKLYSSKGCRAYACQCKWKSIKELTAVESLKDIKWVCGKHQHYT